MQDTIEFNENITIESNIQEKTEQYLLQINRIKLKDYLNSGLIMPDKYLEDCETDIQSKNKNFLVVSDGYINKLDESQILLELILTDDEISKLCQSTDMFYLDFPLPISRIKKIYVQDKKILKHMLVSIENSENGVVPKELFAEYKKGKNMLFEKKEYKPINEEFQIPRDYTNQIRMYDKRMGMFSFMKNASLYYADTRGVATSYSENYFTILSSLLEQPLVEGSYHGLDILKEYPNFRDILYGEPQMDNEFLTSFSEMIEDQEVKELFKQYLKPTGKREILKEFASKNMDIYYLIGLVERFKQRDDNNKLENLKADITDLIPSEKAELSLAILGIYYGYSRLRSYINIDIQDKYIKKIFGTKFNVKFEMNSKLDYITVESIYQKSFNDKKGYDFVDLHYPKTISKIKIPTDKTFKTWYNVDKQLYFDVENIKVEKLTTLEMFGNLLGKYSDEIVENKQSGYLMVFIQYNFCDILRLNEKGQKYFSKNDLLEKLTEKEDENLNKILIDVLSIGKN